MNVIEKIEDLFSNLNEEEKKKVLQHFYSGILVKIDKYYGPDPKIVDVTHRMHVGPAPSTPGGTATQTTTVKCPHCKTKLTITVS